MTQSKWWRLGAAAILSMSSLAACNDEDRVEEEPLEEEVLD
ncbi:hypothetical protein [Metaplanococcus flavidus]|uniref:Secreted protein n=1 Tax=Metaplanococcus flavidus TaxID=569883 RepID=A0ABW3LD45_9BACL